MIGRIPPALRFFTLVAIPLMLLYLASYCAWYNLESKQRVLYGVNFSCKRAEFFNQSCAELFRSILADLGVKHVRLSVYWSDVEQQPGVYDFSAVDQLLDIASTHDARVTVSIGMKAQRYPEFWFPTWLRLAAALPVDGYPEESPLVQDALFPYLEAATRHVGAHPAVEAIQVENEPFVHTEGRWRYASGWRISREFLAREIEAVRAADDGRHPIVVSHASWQRKDNTWRWIVDHADVVAQSVYTKRQRGPWPWLYIFPYRIGPFVPNLPNQARAAAREGKEIWIGELQAEPFEMPSVDIRQISTAEARSFSPRWLRANVELAARSRATRAYLWGVEWWAYLKDVRGEPELWEEARRLFAESGTLVESR
ncbi:MAG: hypothetical protein AB7R89_18065 [Dehalococcoidia bacterium]